MFYKYLIGLLVFGSLVVPRPSRAEPVSELMDAAQEALRTGFFADARKYTIRAEKVMEDTDFVLTSRLQAQVWYLRGLAEWIDEDLEAAEADWRLALQVDPSLPWADDLLPEAQAMARFEAIRKSLPDQTHLDLAIPEDTGATILYVAGHEVRFGDMVVPGRYLVQASCSDQVIQSRWWVFGAPPEYSTLCPGGFGVKSRSDVVFDDFGNMMVAGGESPTPPLQPNAEPISTPSVGQLRSELFHPENPMGVSNGVGFLSREELAATDLAGWSSQVSADGQALDMIAARWYRYHSPGYPSIDMASLVQADWDFGPQDTVIRTLQASDRDVLLVLGRVRGDVSCDEYAKEMPSPLTLEGDAAVAYRDYVRRVAERYDGDGLDDMPGLEGPIRWFQAGTDADLHMAACSPGNVQYETPSQTLALIRLTREGLDLADDNAHLVLGMSWDYTTQRDTGWAEELFRLDHGALFHLIDALNMHDYTGIPDRQLERISSLRRLAGGRMPIWITETSLPSDTEVVVGWTEERQAETLVDLVMGALATDQVSRIFWHSLFDLPYGEVQEVRSPGSESRDGIVHHSMTTYRVDRRTTDQTVIRAVSAASDGFFACARWYYPTSSTIPLCQSWRLKPAGRTFSLLARALEGYTRVEELVGGVGWRIVRPGEGDLVVLRKGKGTFDTSDLMKTTRVQVWRLVATPDTPESLPVRVNPTRVSVEAGPVLLYASP